MENAVSSKKTTGFSKKFFVGSPQRNANTKFQRGLIFFSLFAILLMGLPSAAPAEWTIETVDAPKYFGGFSSRAIGIDKVTNHPHIAYGGDHLYHAYFDGTQWQYEVVDNSPHVGESASIAIDSNNKIHISYLDQTNYAPKLKYATNASGSWVTSTIDYSTSDEWSWYTFTSIAIDSNNKVHISYFRPNYGLKYATNAGGSWVTATIDSAGYVGGGTSIAIDSNNNVHISYHYASNRDLKYATNASGSWVTSTIDSTGVMGYYNSIAIDSNNKVHISYMDWTNGDLKYATNAGGSWVTATIDSAGYVGQYNSIAIDSNNKVHISYYLYFPQFSGHTERLGYNITL